jgi:SET domain-containing protein
MKPHYDLNAHVVVLCGDNARYMNHSDQSNTGNGDHETTVALRGIQVGEELTDNYKTSRDYSEHIN